MSDLKPCPVCDSPAHNFMGYDYGKVGCNNNKCSYRNRPVSMSEWQSRPHENKLKAQAVREAVKWLEGHEETYGLEHGALKRYANKLERG